MLYNPGFQKDRSYVVKKNSDISSLSKLIFSSDSINAISPSCSQVFERIHQRVAIDGKNAITSGIKIDLELIPECVTDSLNRLSKQDYSPNEGDTSTTITNATSPTSYAPCTDYVYDSTIYDCSSGCECPEEAPYCVDGECVLFYEAGNGYCYNYCTSTQTTCTTIAYPAKDCNPAPGTCGNVDNTFVCNPGYDCVSC